MKKDKQRLSELRIKVARDAGEGAPEGDIKCRAEVLGRRLRMRNR